MSVSARFTALLAVTGLLTACGHGKTDAGAEPVVPSALTTPSAPPPADAAADDCNRKVNDASAAAMLGVPDVKENPYSGHMTGQGDTDILECGYTARSPQAGVPTLKYVIYTPVQANVPSVYAGLRSPPKLEPFQASMGVESAAWVGPSGSDRFEAQLNFRTATNVFELHVTGLPSIDAAKQAVVKLATGM